MNMYYFFRQHFIDDRKLMKISGTMYYKGQKTNEINFDDGVLIDKEKYRAPFQIIVNEKNSTYKNRLLTDMILLTVVSMGPMKLVSPKCAAILEKQKLPNVQIFDVDIKASDFELHGYKLLNIVGKYDCIDIEKSQIEFNEDGNIFDIESLILDYKKIPENRQLFLLGRDQGATILIHENLKQIMENEKLTGIFYEPLDEG